MFRFMFAKMAYKVDNIYENIRQGSNNDSSLVTYVS